MFQKKISVLAIGAHPDDIELGCGGSLALHKYCGDQVFSLILSRGEASGDPVARERECRESIDILGIDDLFFGDLRDTYIEDGPKTIKLIEEVIEKTSPTLIYTHSIKDSHQDHRNTGLATMSAGRRIDCILMYETPSTLREFSPHFFVDIGKTFELKLKAAGVFKSQNDKFWMEAKAVEGLTKYRGFQAGCTHAEAFEVAKYVVRYMDEENL